jgi:hypothetical protein
MEKVAQWGASLFFCTPYIITQMKSRRLRCVWNGRVQKHVEGFGGKSRGKRPLGKPWRIWENEFKMDLRNMVGVVEWIHLAMGRDRWGLFICCDEPSDSGATDIFR